MTIPHGISPRQFSLRQTATAEVIPGTDPERDSNLNLLFRALRTIKIT
jgi:hypothetical protein